jgi:hypothetical protein
MNRIAAAGGAIAFVLLLAVAVQTSAAPAPGTDSGRLGAVREDASSADVLSIQHAVPGVMTDWIAAGRVTGEVGDRDQLGMIMASLGDDAESARRALLAGVLTERLIEPQVEHFTDQFWSALYNAQPSTIYVGNRFEVAEWDGIQVLGDVARVLVSARQNYTFPNGTEGAEPWHQYLLVLERAPRSRYGWVLIERSASQAPRAGSETLSDR